MKVVKRTFKLLALLRHFEELPLKRIAASLGVEANSAWNLLDFLRKEGYVEKCGAGRYKLGAEFRNLAGGGPAAASRGILEAELSRLSASVKESSVAVRLGKSGLEVLHGINFERDVMVSNKVYEQPDALYCWASGHVLLAWQPETVLEGVIACNGLPKASQWPSAQSRVRLNAELAKIRELGFAERFAKASNIHSLAMPVLIKGRPPMAIGVNYPGFRNTAIHREAILGNLKQTAGKLSGKL